jgi:hypothetical protein
LFVVVLEERGEDPKLFDVFVVGIALAEDVERLEECYYHLGERTWRRGCASIIIVPLN